MGGESGITEYLLSEPVNKTRDELGSGEKQQKQKDELGSGEKLQMQKGGRKRVRPVIPDSDMHLNASVVRLLLSLTSKDPRATIAMLLAIKKKQQEISSNRQFPPAVLDPEYSEELQDLQNEHDALEDEYSQRRHAIEREFMRRVEPIYGYRNAIVAGHNGMGVPHFWLSAMLSIGVLRNEITKDDEEVLKYLVEIRSVGSCTDPWGGLNICFVFGSNPFFKNVRLSKSFHFVTGFAHQSVAERAEGTSIDWVEGKCLTQKYSQKKSACRSFFNFFETNDDLESHLLIASVIVEEVVPCAVKLYKRMELRGLHIK